MFLARQIIESAIRLDEAARMKPWLLTFQEYYDLVNPEGRSHSSEAYDNELKDFAWHTKSDYPHLLKRVSVTPRDLPFEESYGPPAYDLLAGGIVSRDVYEHPQHYASNVQEPGMRFTWREILRVRNKPDSQLRIYYVGELTPGETVYLASEYAAQAGYHHSDQKKDLKPKSAIVRASDVTWPGDDLSQFEYSPMTRGAAVLEYRAKKESGWGVSITVWDGDRCVADASDEWGCVLYRVAREFRGMGIGTTLGHLYRSIYPAKPSGGFTPNGSNNFFRIYRKFVLDAQKYGKYRQAIAAGEITPQKVQDILAQPKLLSESARG